ncbi:hypothetical protein GGR57DRAFT_91908 [Xylariaceae sp. FL1272]|nr:hypothetical protein GGR57DRAFT_91908 [Xylariaceae sp. FL1272]
MASEGAIHRILGPMDYGLDSQESTRIESGLLGPLVDSQETQDAQDSQILDTTQWTEISPSQFDLRADSHADTTEPREYTVPYSQPFIGRPQSEAVDDIHAGFGFQFANAPISRESLQRSKKPSPSIEPQRLATTASDHMDGPDSLPHASRPTRNASPSHLTRAPEKGAPRNRAGAGEDIRKEKYAYVSSNSSSDSPEAAGILRSEHHTLAHEEHPLESQCRMTVPSAAQSHQASGRNTSMVHALNFQDSEQRHAPMRSDVPPGAPLKDISTPVKCHRTASRSSLGFLKTKKLPKAYSNIQRKAHIQMSPLAGRVASRRLSPKARTGESSTTHCSKKKNTQNDSTKRAASPARSTPTVEHQYSDPQVEEFANLSRDDFREFSSQHSQQLPEMLDNPSILHVDAHSAMQSRPTSQVSNISKKRISRNQRDASKRTRDHRSPNLHECQTKQSELAQAWNNHFTYSTKLSKHYEAKLAMMAKQIAAQTATIGQYLDQIQEKDESILQLANENREATTRCEEQSAQLTRTKKKQERMQEKLHEYKNHLNEATREQQKIFTYCRAKHQQTVEEVKLEEQKRRDFLEKALQSSDNVRQEVQKMVSDVKTTSLQEIQQLNLRIESLQVELSEREREVSSEKDHAVHLREELSESRRMTEEALKSLGEQQQHLIKLGLQARSDTQDVKERVEKQDQSIMTIMRSVEENREVAENSSQLIDELRKQQNNALETVLSEFREHVASSSELSSNITESFKADVSTISDLCSNLKKLFQSESGWKEKCEQASRDCRSLSDHLREQEDELREARSAAEQHYIQCRELSDELQAVTEGCVPISEFNGQMNALQLDNQRLQQALDEQTQSGFHADERLRATNEELLKYRNQAQTQNEQIQVDRDNHRQQLEQYSNERERAIKQAISDEAERCQAERERIEQRLRESEDNRNRLEEQLSQVNQAAKNPPRNGNNEENEAMQQALDNTIALTHRLLNDMQGTQKASDDLKAMFEKWSNDQIELGLLRVEVQKLAVDKAAVVESRAQLDERMIAQRRLEDTAQKQRSEVESLKKAVKERVRAGSSKHFEHQVGDADSLVFDASTEEVRRVSIKSPANEDGIDMPLSIDEERDMRRFGTVPKSIMKQGSDATPLLEQALGEMASHAQAQTALNDIVVPAKRKRKTIKRSKSSHFSRSAYNRPVLGTASNDVDSADEISRQSEPGKPVREDKRKRSQHEDDPIESVDEHPQMRRRHNRANQTQATPQPSSSRVSNNPPGILESAVPVEFASEFSSERNVRDNFFSPLNMTIL